MVLKLETKSNQSIPIKKTLCHTITRPFPLLLLLLPLAAESSFPKCINKPQTHSAPKLTKGNIISYYYYYYYMGRPPTPLCVKLTVEGTAYIPNLI
jgi:hypothetical protein